MGRLVLLLSLASLGLVAVACAPQASTSESLVVVDVAADPSAPPLAVLTCTGMPPRTLVLGSLQYHVDVPIRWALEGDVDMVAAGLSVVVSVDSKVVAKVSSADAEATVALSEGQHAVAITVEDASGRWPGYLSTTCKAVTSVICHSTCWGSRPWTPAGPPANPINHDCHADLRFGGHVGRVVSLSFPSEPSDYECDANRDGVVDKRDGAVNQAFHLASLLYPAVPSPDVALAQSIASGNEVWLASLANGWLNVHRGLRVDPLGPCFDVATVPADASSLDEVQSTEWNGVDQCHFEVDPVGFDGTACPTAAFHSAVFSEGRVELKSTRSPFKLPVGPPATSLDVENGQLSGNYDGGLRIRQGRFCGRFDGRQLQSLIEARRWKATDELALTYLGSLGNLLLAKNCGTAKSTHETPNCTFVFAFETVDAASLDPDESHSSSERDDSAPWGDETDASDGQW